MICRLVGSFLIVAFCGLGTALSSEDLTGLSAILGKVYEDRIDFANREFEMVFLSEFIRKPYSEEKIQRLINTSVEKAKRDGHEPSPEDVANLERFYRMASKNQEHAFRKVRFINTPHSQRIDRVELLGGELERILNEEIDYTDTYIKTNEFSVWLNYDQKTLTYSGYEFDFWNGQGFQYSPGALLDTFLNIGRSASGETDLSYEDYFVFAFESEIFTRVFSNTSVVEENGEILFTTYFGASDHRFNQYIIDKETNLLTIEVQYEEDRKIHEKTYIDYQTYGAGDIMLPSIIEINRIDPYTNNELQERQNIVDISFRTIEDALFDFSAFDDYRVIDYSN